MARGGVPALTDALASRDAIGTVLAGAVYVVADHRGFTRDNPRLEQRLDAWPELAPLSDSWLDTQDTTYFPVNHDYPAGHPGYPGWTLTCTRAWPRHFLCVARILRPGAHIRGIVGRLAAHGSGSAH